MKVFICILWAVLILPQLAFAQTDNLSRLLNAKTIRCNIEEGYTSTFDGQKRSFEKGAFSKNPEDSILTYIKIDLEQGSALVVGNAGTDDIIVRPGATGLNFIDFTNAGAMMTSTIFSNRYPDGGYFFVTSRHSQLSLGDTTSLPSQWIGKCKIIE